MEFHELSPVWIIDTRGGESDFCDKMSLQFQAFSRNELGGLFEESSHRWWKVESLSNPSNIKIDDKGHPSDIPAYGLPAGNYDLSALTVVVVSSLDSLGEAVDVVKKLQKKRAESSFMKGTADLVRYYGLLVFPKGVELKSEIKNLLMGEAAPPKSKKKKKEEEEPLPFDTLFLQGESNRVDGNGQTYSYDHLDSDEKTDLTVQIVHHLALTQGTLSDLSKGQLKRRQYCVAGAFSLHFETEKESCRIADELTKVIFDKFVNNNSGEHWLKESEAAPSDDFQKQQGWDSVYGRLRLGFNDLETTELVPQPPISPWKLLSKYLLPKYYRNYIKGLVRQVHDNATAFSFLTLTNYGNHLDDQYEKAVKSGELRTKIETELLKVWDKNCNKNLAIGMKQFMSRLDRMTDFYATQKETIEGLQNNNTSDGKKTSFPKLADLPLGSFGEYQKKYAEYFRKEGVSAKRSEDTRGGGKLKKVTRILSFHPVALSLLVRSMLLGVLLPMVILTALRLIPDVLFNTSWIESYPGSLVFCVSCFVISILWAVLKYHFLVVDGVRQKIKDYIGWSLYRTQMVAYHMTLDKEVEYYKEACSICNEIKQRAKVFYPEKDDDKQLAEEQEFRENYKENRIEFNENKFQTDIMSVYEEKNLLNMDAIIPRIKTSINQYGAERTEEQRVYPVKEKMDDMHYGVLRRMMMVKDDRVLDVMKAILFEHSSDCTPIDVISNLKDSIKEDVCFYLGDLVINSLTDIAFPTNDEPQNLNRWEGKDYEYTVGDVIRERSFPSAETSSAFTFASVLIPDREQNNSEDMQKWRRLLGLENSSDDNRFDTAKGAFELSVLQGAAVSSISQVKDIIIK